MIRRLLVPGGVAAWVAVVAVAFLVLEPSRTLPLEALLRLARGFGIALAALLALAGAGGFLLARWAPVALEDDLGGLRAVGVGLVAWGLLSLPASALLGVHPWVGGALLVLLAGGWLARPPVHLPRVGGRALGLGVLILSPGLLLLLAPPTDTDELYYHLALPARMLASGHLEGGPWMPNGSRPLAIHLPWAWLMAFGGREGPRAFHWVLSGLLLWGLHRQARTRWGIGAGIMAPLLLAGSTTFLAWVGLAYNDVPAAFLAWLALDVALRGGPAWLLATVAGGALAVKYTAAAVVVPVLGGTWLLAAVQARHPFRGGAGRALLAGAASLLVVAPWWARNLVEGLHPLFPYAGWGLADMPFQFPEKYGLGRDLAAFLRLPWDAVVRAETDSFVFLGRVNPAFLALAPAAVLAGFRDRTARALALAWAAGFGLWALGPQWLRYLLPVLPVAALAAAAGLASLPRPARILAWLCLAAGLPANLAPVLSAAAAAAPVVTGRVDEDAWRARRDDAWPAVRWLNGQAEPDATVALLFAWQAGGLERAWTLGSVEDHVPTRAFLRATGEDALQVLREAGVDYVLEGRPRFLHKAMPFLDARTFQDEFRGAEDRLHALLEREAELVFTEGRYLVWRL